MSIPHILNVRPHDGLNGPYLLFLKYPTNIKNDKNIIYLFWITINFIDKKDITHKSILNSSIDVQ